MVLVALVLVGGFVLWDAHVVCRKLQHSTSKNHSQQMSPDGS